MERGLGHISVHAVGQSRVGGVEADYARLHECVVLCGSGVSWQILFRKISPFLSHRTHSHSHGYMRSDRKEKHKGSFLPGNDSLLQNWGISPSVRSTAPAHKPITLLLKSWNGTQNQAQAEIVVTSGSTQTRNHFWHMMGLVLSLPGRTSSKTSNKSHLLDWERQILTPNPVMGKCQTKNSLIQRDSYVRTSLSLTWWAEPETSKPTKRLGKAESQGERLCGLLTVFGHQFLVNIDNLFASNV